MAYNLDLEYRIDNLIIRLGDISKRKMFGGVGYLINGNMCFGIYRDSLIVRTTPEKANELLSNEYVSPFDITGRPMKGWVMISLGLLETDDELLDMVKLGINFAEALPSK